MLKISLIGQRNQYFNLYVFINFFLLNIYHLKKNSDLIVCKILVTP